MNSHNEDKGSTFKTFVGCVLTEHVHLVSGDIS